MSLFSVIVAELINFNTHMLLKSQFLAYSKLVYTIENQCQFHTNRSVLFILACCGCPYEYNTCNKVQETINH